MKSNSKETNDKKTPLLNSIVGQQCNKVGELNGLHKQYYVNGIIQYI